MRGTNRGMEEWKKAISNGLVMNFPLLKIPLLLLVKYKIEL